jgi:hypothetical protein
VSAKTNGTSLWLERVHVVRLWPVSPQQVQRPGTPAALGISVKLRANNKGVVTEPRYTR